MSEKVSFNLVHNGRTYRFLFTFRDEEQLFRTITDHVAILTSGTHELFWKDEDSDVVLETSDDFSAALDFAMYTRKSPTDNPCIHLAVKEVCTIKSSDSPTVADELTQGVSADKHLNEAGALIKAVSSPSKPLIQMKEDSQQSRRIIEQLTFGSNPMQQQLEEDTTQDFDARQRELKIRAKALQMKEEVFERQFAVFQLKMEELEEKLQQVDTRVDNIEEKMNNDSINSKWDDIEKNFKQRREKGNGIYQSGLSGADFLNSVYGGRVDCSFYSMMGVCRHGYDCNREHIIPKSSKIVLLKHIFHRPAVDYLINDKKDQEDQEFFDDFFEEIYSELTSKYGEIEMIVCDNQAEHMIGNVYVKFQDEPCAAKAVAGLSNRWFNGEPIDAELSPTTDFRKAICRQYDQGRCYKGCFCYFLHSKAISPDLQKRLFGDRATKSSWIRA